jgi:hypothetical protein
MVRDVRTLSSKGWQIEKIDPRKDDIVEIIRAREKLAVKGLTDEQTYRLKLSRHGCVTFTARKNGRFAFLTANAEHGDIVELGGSREGVSALVAQLFETQFEGKQRTDWLVNLPAYQTEYHSLFLGLAEWWEVVPSGRMAILDLRKTLEEISPLLNEKGKGSGEKIHLVMTGKKEEQSVSLCLEDNVRVSDESAEELSLNRKEMVSLLFGPAKPTMMFDLPSSMRWLDSVLPFPMCMPKLWCV